jgi:hypothetical protein
MLKKQIQIIYEKFCSLFKKNEEQNKQDINEEYLCSVCFGLNDDFDIGIIGSFPPMKNSTMEEIANIGEKYAQLLLSVNKGLLAKDTLNILDNRYKSSEDHKEQLFLQNVLIFYNLLNEEIAKVQNTNQPLISPSAVFNKK